MDQKFKIIKEIPFQELEKRLRNVPLVQKGKLGEDIYVYENAEIKLRELNTKEINPTTFYVLSSNLKFQKDLRKYLLEKYNIDTLHLTRGYELENEKQEIWTLIPPIVEITSCLINFRNKKDEINYSDNVKIKIPVLVDGAHRLFSANTNNFAGICISNVLEQFPFYAYPNEWERIKQVDFVPENKNERKFYLKENCYNLYRDFGVLGCGAPRGKEK
ncbi:MAG: hypothetical protein ACP5N2_07455 [Candidatus Nanoarchaeia archaeon]